MMGWDGMLGYDRCLEVLLLFDTMDGVRMIIFDVVIYTWYMVHGTWYTMEDILQ